MKTISVSGAIIELHDSGLTVTRYPGLEPVPAYPQDNDDYKKRAYDHGYGTDLLTMSRDHELTHHLLAKFLGLPYSPTLMGVAKKKYWPMWYFEEAAVLGFQAYARAAKIPIEKLLVE